MPTWTLIVMVFSLEKPYLLSSVPGFQAKAYCEEAAAKMDELYAKGTGVSIRSRCVPLGPS